MLKYSIYVVIISKQMHDNNQICNYYVMFVGTCLAVHSAHLSVSDWLFFVVGSAWIPWRERTQRTSGGNIYWKLPSFYQKSALN